MDKAVGDKAGLKFPEFESVILAFLKRVAQWAEKELKIEGLKYEVDIDEEDDEESDVYVIWSESFNPSLIIEVNTTREEIIVYDYSQMFLKILEGELPALAKELKINNWEIVWPTTAQEGTLKITKPTQQNYYKVVDENLKSLGMKPKGRAVPIIQYAIGKWIYPLEPISKDPDKGGGLWVHPTKSYAFGTARYIWRRYKRRVRVFECVIGRVVCQPSSYRAKTDKVMLLVEIPIEHMYK